eukprot:UN14255
MGKRTEGRFETIKSKTWMKHFKEYLVELDYEYSDNKWQALDWFRILDFNWTGCDGRISDDKDKFNARRPT